MTTTRPRRHALYGVTRDDTAYCVCGRTIPEADLETHLAAEDTLPVEEFTPDQAEHLARIEGAPLAPESLPERVAAVIYAELTKRLDVTRHRSEDVITAVEHAADGAIWTVTTSALT